MLQIHLALQIVKAGRIHFNEYWFLWYSVASGYASEHILSSSIVAGRESVVKIPLGAWLGLTLTLICVAAAGLLVVIQWEVWVSSHSHLCVAAAGLLVVIQCESLLSLSSVCGCCRPASGRTVWEHQQSIKNLINSNLELGEYKGNLCSCPQVLHVSCCCFFRVLLSIRS